MRPHDGRTSAVHRAAHGSKSSSPRPAIEISGRISNQQFLPGARIKPARPASFHWRALLESSWVVKPENGGGGGNRTPVPRPFHVSFYRNSPLFVSRPSVSKGQDTSGPASGVFRAFARRPRSGAILYCGLRPGFSEEKESGEGAALLGSHFEIAVTSYVFPGVL